MLTAKEVNAALRTYYERNDHLVCEEIALPNKLRFDILALSPAGRIVGLEVKVSTSDLGRDVKWMRYLEYCDDFFFACGPEVNITKVPPGQGLVCVYDAMVLWERQPAPSRGTPRGRSATLCAMASRLKEHSSRLRREIASAAGRVTS